MAISLIDKLRDIDLAVVDVETTGASAEWGHRVIEIGIVRISGGSHAERFEQLIDPHRSISPGVSALTGITQEMVRGQPTFEQILPRVAQLLGGAVVLGHNVRFDLGFLYREFRRGRLEITQALGPAQVLDTLRIARRRFGRGGNGLQALAPRLGVLPPVAHRALADALTTAAVFERLLEPCGGWGMCLCDVIQQQGLPMGLLPVGPRQSLLPLELEEALEMKSTVVMEYVDARGERTLREIQPLSVRRSAGELMLVAHCHMRQEQRTFKVDRIVRLSRQEAPPPLFAGAAVSQSPADATAEPAGDPPC